MGFCSRRTVRAAAAVFVCAVLSACTLPGAGTIEDTPNTTPVAGKPVAAAPVPAFAAGVPLVTSNAGSAIGAANRAEALVARVWPAVFVKGPKGEYIPNKDIATGTLVPGPDDTRRAIYTINKDAVFSDGDPLTCDDFVLAWKAGTTPHLFHSFMPLMWSIRSIHCFPGSKNFTVIFHPGQGRRWHELFAAGQVLPAHTIAHAAGIDEKTLTLIFTAGAGLPATDIELGIALAGRDPQAMVAAVAQAWNDGFHLDQFNPAMQVSSGPYMIDSVRVDGSVVLVANPRYVGSAPEFPKMIVYPGAGAQRLDDDPVPVLADVSGNPAAATWVNHPVDGKLTGRHYTVTETAGLMTETVLLSDAGPLATPDARRALAACIGPQNVAEVSSKVSGFRVPAVGVRLASAGTPGAERLSDLELVHLGVDLAEAKRLAGTYLRIGYVGPNRRLALMVDAMRASCARAGITIVDASSPTVSAADLSHPGPADQNGLPTTWGGTLDGFIMALDPGANYPQAASDSDTPDLARKEENMLWEQCPTIPLAAEPRAVVADTAVGNVRVNTGRAGVGWNMDRWTYK